MTGRGAGFGATTQATANDATRKSAARNHGAPGNEFGGAMEIANRAENMPGPITIAMLRREPSAPCNSPCSDGERAGS